jgi:alpha-1,2-mannosyltransferase
MRRDEESLLTARGSGAIAGDGSGADLGVQRARRIAIALCLALLLALVYSYVSLYIHGDVSAKQTDFLSYYGGAHFVWYGHPSNMYDFNALGAYEKHVAAPDRLRDSVLPYLYPPFVALIFAPLAALKIAAAFLIWVGISFILLAGSLYAISRQSGLSRDASIFYWVVGISLLPAFVGLAQGQTSLLLLALMTMSVLALLNRQPALAGAALALALVKPPYVLPFLVVLLVSRQWKAMASFAVVAAALFAIPSAALGLSVNSGYADTMRKASGWRTQLGGWEPKWNHSLEGFFSLLVATPVSTILTYAADAAVLALVAWCAWNAADLEVPLVVAAVAALLISPHVLVHDLSLLLLPAGLATSWKTGRGRWLALILAGGYLLTLVNLRFVTVTHIQVSVLVMVAFAAWLALHTRSAIRIRAESVPTATPRARQLEGAPS